MTTSLWLELLSRILINVNSPRIRETSYAGNTSREIGDIDVAASIGLSTKTAGSKKKERC